jgi:hypothetical protein
LLVSCKLSCSSKEQEQVGLILLCASFLDLFWLIVVLCCVVLCCVVLCCCVVLYCCWILQFTAVNCNPEVRTHRRKGDLLLAPWSCSVHASLVSVAHLRPHDTVVVGEETGQIQEQNKANTRRDNQKSSPCCCVIFWGGPHPC